MHYKVLEPDDPERYPNGHCVVRAEWTADTDRSEDYMAEGMSRQTADILVTALEAEASARG